MKKIRGDWPRAVGTRLNIGHAIEFTGSAVGQTLHVPCARGHKVDVQINGHTAPDAVAKRMLGAGWTIGRKLLCPKHSRKSKAPAPEPVKQEEVMPDTVNGIELTPPAKPATTVSDRARAAQREALNWLTESFNVEKGTYCKDVSDASIAKETGLAVNVIVQLREQFYGPLKAPSEIEEFRTAFKALRSEISAQGDKSRDAVRTLELRLDRLCEKHGW